MLQERYLLLKGEESPWSSGQLQKRINELPALGVTHGMITDFQARKCPVSGPASAPVLLRVPLGKD
jgi:hypothetical protein